MIFAYCGECKKIMLGGYFPSNDKDIKIFQCVECSGLTCTENKNYEFDFINHDVKLRSEGVRLQNNKYKTAMCNL